MKLPSDYLTVIDRGATALRALGARLRAAAAQEPDAPELWLSVRDFDGLAGRLADSTDWEWRHGFADLMISPQDFGVLDELIARRRIGPVRLSHEDATAITLLRAFLRRYCDRKFELDAP